MTEIYNFSPGPSMIPKKVLLQAKKEFCNWNNKNKSIMEISHRSEEFISVIQEMKKNLKILLNIPDNYEIIFSHGGARGQFSAVPMNLLNNNNIKKNQVDYVNSGYWSNCATQEAMKYCNNINIININKMKHNKIKISSMKDWNINNNSKYLHYCPNETINGIAIYEEPFFSDDIIVVGDFSSTILSQNICIKKYGIIYASSQKNIGPSGVTLIIIRKNLLKNINFYVPSILNYKILVDSNSMFNTPNTFSLYLSNLVIRWLKQLGGISKIEKKNIEKSNMLYNVIDSTDFYINNIDKCNRSRMNIPFRIVDSRLHSLFLIEAEKYRLYSLKGHSILGGIRASLYNAMPLKGVIQLTKFMKIFEKKYG
ncbi:MAG: 3-phosphoserine/phosphohydroxythreonine transaminase [Buchnera aphidicola (Chaetogeoica yunlongensis)]